MLLVWSLVLGPVVVAGILLYQSRSKDPLASVPGPFWASLTRLWLLRQIYSGELHMRDIKAHEKYGPIYRAGPKYVIVNDPAFIHEAHKWNRSDWFITLDPQVGLQSVGTARTMAQHNSQRRRIASAYNPDSVYELEPLLDRSIQEFMEVLSTKFASKGKVCDLADFIHFFAFDAIMDLAFSDRVGFVKEGRDVNNIIGSLTELFNITRIMTTFPELQRFLNHPWVNPLLGSQPTDDYGPGMIRGMAIKEVRRRVKHGSPRESKDLLDRFLQYRDAQGKGIPQRELEVEAFTPVIAGPESVATILRVAVVYIVGTPRVYRKLMAEIQAGEDSGRLSSPVSFRETKEFVFLNAIIKEVFRIHPPIGTPFPRTVPPQGTTISGHFLPGGCDVGFSMWALGRNKTVFGEDVDVFRPERWLTDPETIQAYEKADLTFSAGLTTCLGKHIALCEIQKTLFELFRNFEIDLADPLRPCITNNILTFVVHDMLVYLTRRKRETGKEGALGEETVADGSQSFI
ncbi:cytochrome P450 [Aspergillus heteromorphus CBS 117.55]|uniref:Cytochrome P450 n=1 Tax=Aspergillus heteromorphus CBS 117.55 TaxID=1448321 RepID=A0A317X241_9EURO|nr:cytochrome P450 [Aspergillus heteromorphus CBS 117.55]PWY92201.1 cytochrome P450 [Aspergillus heteromorphus CBS 117.55]